MFTTIKNKIELHLAKQLEHIDKAYALKRISPLLFNSIKEFALRPGKRVRPTLFVLGYLGYARKEAAQLYTSAVSIELLHDFMLVHDDIIDKSATRRGKPSLHVILGKALRPYPGLKFSGQDLAIVAGDVLYALALHAFLAINEKPRRKEAAMKKLIEAAFYTGCGEFIELVFGAKAIDKLTREDIYHIYDLKTANYTFASPLTIGATLAGASLKEIRKLHDYGIYLGRAFQIKDDIIGLFSSEKDIGKSTLTDLQESKKTLLLWSAWNNAGIEQKRRISAILVKKTITRGDLRQVRAMVISTRALDYAKNEVQRFLEKAGKIQDSINMSPRYKHSLHTYARRILNV